MSDGNLMATFLIVFRETLEAGLIVGIILAVLSRLKAGRYTQHVWLSVVLAVVASGLAGWALSEVTEIAKGRWEQIIEGVISLLACIVVTWMVFWMDRQSKRIRPEVETRVETAVSKSELAAIMLLPFLAVLREGAETVLFLVAVAIQSAGAGVSLAGGIMGASLAVGVTVAIFVGGRHIPLKALFRSTGFLLLLIAAGLLAYGVHELQELGWLPTFLYPVWDINNVLNEKEGLGAFLKSLFGYNGNPSLLEVTAYVTYLSGVIYALRRLGKATTPPPASPEPTLEQGTQIPKQLPMSPAVS